ncbi:MAG TPA: cytochrome c maturation protein CcmE [Stellaceae bacterium]|nr:cytochrome c maturation protein CcmE [Stellaceae bacterium]
MTRKRRRLIAVLVGMGCLGVAATLVLSALRDNLVFFYSPSDIKAKGAPQGRLLHIGGLVEQASVEHEPDGKTVDFRITDGSNTVAVVFRGPLPDLFREGQGVIAEGKLDGNGVLRADSVLAKHDENYMPREVVNALKRSGHWQEGGTPPTAVGQAKP